jgi:hypothetical protein
MKVTRSIEGQRLMISYGAYASSGELGCTIIDDT